MKRQTFLAAASAAAAFANLPRWARADEQTLRSAAAAAGIVYGANIRNMDDIDRDSGYVELIEKQCAAVIAGLSFQWLKLRPAPGKFDFGDADRVRDFARSHGLKLVEGHLVWHKAGGGWLGKYLTQENAKDTLVNHIQTVCSRYAGQIYSWNVVNEALNPKEGRPDGLRNSVWLQYLGPNYLDIAFQTAAAADPKAILVYNDYGVENDNTASEHRRVLMLQMLDGMLGRKTPVQAVGIQAHIRGTPSGFHAPGLSKFIRDLGSRGLKVFITELDIDDSDLPSDAATRDTIVGKCYSDFLNTVLPEPNVSTVVTWGLADKYDWKNKLETRGGRPDGQPQRNFPFGPDLEPKPPVLNAMLAAFAAAPKR